MVHTANSQEEVLDIAGLGWIGSAKRGNNEDGDGSARAGAAAVITDPPARRRGVGVRRL